MMMSQMPSSPNAYAPLNRLEPVAAQLSLASPVLIVPATKPNGAWTIKSDSQNRPLQSTVMVNPETGTILSRQGFRQKYIIDRVLLVGIAAHEGQLFGLANQLLSLATAMGLVLLSVSAVVLWWRRRSVGVLGAPIPLGRPRWSFALVAVIVALAAYLPAMAASLALVLLLEKFVFPYIPGARKWLGLSPA
jgi:uncharacterized iron-regulated membrane protein